MMRTMPWSRSPILSLLLCALSAGSLAAQESRSPDVHSGDAGAAPSSDTVSLPSTPAGERARELLSLLENPETSRVQAFVAGAYEAGFRDMFPINEHLEILGRVARETGGLAPAEVQRSTETALTLRVRSRSTGEAGVLELRVAAEPPHGITGLSLREPRPADAVPMGEPPPGKLDGDVLAEELAVYVDRLAEADAFSGVVALARGDEVLLHRAHGEANKRYAIPNRPDTKINLGSMNKMFTAVAVARLAEEGRLAYGDTIGAYLGSDWVRPDVGRRVRVEHLLTHTSGLGSYFGEEFRLGSRARFRDLEDFRELVRDDSLRFEPGTEWLYSNTGYLLLGAIIEEVTGRDYEDYVREVVYEPAGMEDTGAYAMDEPVPNLAYGYTREEGRAGVRYRNNLFEHVIRGGPAGGGFSTAPDLLAFARALRAGELVSRETLARMTTPKPELGSPEYGYGFGFWQGGRFYGHSGGFPGISSVLLMEREEEGEGEPYALVVLGNYSEASQPVLQKALQLLEAAR